MVLTPEDASAKAPVVFDLPYQLMRILVKRPFRGEARPGSARRDGAGKRIVSSPLHETSRAA
jgi:hypothetical protein